MVICDGELDDCVSLAMLKRLAHTAPMEIWCQVPVVDASAKPDLAERVKRFCHSFRKRFPAARFFKDPESRNADALWFQSDDLSARDLATPIETGFAHAKAFRAPPQ